MRVLAALAVIGVLGAACGDGRPAPPAPGPACSVPGDHRLPAGACAARARAQAQTSLVIFGVTTNTTALTDAFERYFGLRPGVIRYTFRVAAPGRAVPADADVYWSGQPGLAGVAGGFLRPVDWARDFGVAAADLLGDGRSVYTHDDFRAGLVYNRDRVEPRELPHTYQDLLRPRWRGAIVMNASAAPVDYIALAVGDAAGDGEALRIARGLAGSPPGTGQARFVRTTSEVRAEVASGRFALGLGVDGGPPTTQEESLAEHAIEPIPLARVAAGVPGGARSPDLAALFVYWIGATADGQAWNERVFGKSRHTVAGSRAARYIAGRRYVLASPELEMTTISALDRRFSPLFSPAPRP